MQDWDIEQESHDLDDDGFFAQDNFIFIKTAEEDLEEGSVAVELKLFLNEVNQKESLLLLKNFTLNQVAQTTLCIGNDFTNFDKEGEVHKIESNTLDLNIFVDDYVAPQKISIYANEL